MATAIEQDSQAAAAPLAHAAGTRGVVISNCQSLPLKHALTLLCRDVTFDHLGVHVLGEDRAAAIDRFVTTARQDYDHIVTVGLSAEFGPLASDQIRATFAGQTVTSIATIYHAGLHPDLLYIGGMAQRLQGPLSDYHSRIALTGYLHGMDAAAIVGLYTSATYERLGYLDAHDRSIAELVAREAALDVAVSPLILELYRSEPILLSVNHPTAALVLAFAKRIAAHLHAHHGVRLSDWHGTAAELANDLAFSDIFPVFPEIARHHGLTYPGHMMFKPQAAGGLAARPLDLAGFVAGELAAFAAAGREAIARSHQGAEILARQDDPRHAFG